MDSGHSDNSTIQGGHHMTKQKNRLGLKKVENSGESKEEWHDMLREEEDLIGRLHQLLGDRWTLIAGRLPNRSAEEVEKYWRMKEKEKFKQNKLFKPICVRASPPLKLARAAESSTDGRKF